MTRGTLSEFVRDQRDEIIARCRARVASRVVPRPTALELEHGIPVFLRELEHTLASGDRERSEAIAAAGEHGEQLLRSGFTIAQVVHDYGDVCQTITELAIERSAPITTDEFRALNHCLDNAIADAVTAYARRHQREVVIAAAHDANQHLESIASELRGMVTGAIVAFDVLRTGTVGIQGSTGDVLEHGLLGVRDRLDRSLTEVRVSAGLARPEPLVVAGFLDDLESSAVLAARAHRVRLTVSRIDPGVVVETDRQILSSILSSLLQNAFDYTRPHSHVRLHTRATSDRIVFEVEDQCGGIPPATCDQLLAQYAEPRNDRTGRGLELCVRGAQLLRGDIRVCNRNHGCLFTVDLPRTLAAP